MHRGQDVLARRLHRSSRIASYIACVFAGDVYVAGQFTGEIAPDMTKDRTIRALTLQAIEEKIRAARESHRDNR